MAEAAVMLFELIAWGAFWDAINRQSPDDPEGCRLLFDSEWQAHHLVRIGAVVIPWTYSPWDGGIPGFAS